jgi:hypothetical protein
MFEPSPAERARTVLRAAPSVSVLTMPHHVDEISVHGADTAGRPLLLVGDGSRLATAVAAEPEDLTCVVHAVDVCPTPIPDRVRAELWVGGWLVPVPVAERASAAIALAEREPAGELLDIGAGQTLLRLEVAEVSLREAMSGSGQPAAICPGTYAAAIADPLIDGEAEWLGHLVTSHPAEFAQLCLLVPEGLRPPGSCLRPVALDRYGFRFRIDGPARPRHVRLAFHAPLECAGQLPRAMAGLLEAAAVRSGCCAQLGR